MPTCKQCKTPRNFETYSELRSHQWASHGEMYRKNGQKGGTLTSQMTKKQRENKTYTCKRCGAKNRGHKAMIRHAWTHREINFAGRNKKVSKELVPTVRMLKQSPETTHVLEPVVNKEMTAKELLDKLYSQRDFMNSVTKLIEGMLTK